MAGRILSALGALFLCAMLGYLAGMWTTYKEWWPWQKATELQEAARAWRATGQFLPGGSYGRRRPGAAEAGGLVIHDRAAAAEGYWLISRLSPETEDYRIDIVDPDGRTVSSRPVDYSRLAPGAPPRQLPHSAALLRDGSVLVVWDEAQGLARLDACGDPIWARTDQLYHHSLDRGTDGFWTWQARSWYGGQDQRMVRFDPMTGEILESIDLIDDVIAASEANRLALEIPEDFRFDRTFPRGTKADLFHPNDVEELTPDLAGAFPGFSAGDLLVSLRNLDMIAVIGRENHRIKWARYGPWNRQHDPDFQPDGTISLFSNNTDRFRSALMQVDPRTGKAEDMFFGTGLAFDSNIMGVHQALPNGNQLITVAMEGRVIEVTPDGRIVKEFNNVINARYSAIVSYAEFRPTGYLAEIPACPAD